MSATGKRRKRAAKVAVATAAVATVGAAVAAATGVGLNLFGGDSDGSDKTNLPPATAQVTRQTLLDTETTSGELGYGEPTTVGGRLPGTVTGLPTVGGTVSRGEAIYRLDNEPVVLMYGTLPAYRTLADGANGPDVQQFEQNLAALGYGGFTVDNSFTGSTASAVRAWQGDLGIAKTGKVELGRVYYTPAAVRVHTWVVKPGNPVGPGAPVLTYTGSAQVVTVEIPYTYRQLARVGNAVAVTLPDGTSVPGTISGSTMVIRMATSAEEKDTTVFEVTVTVTDASKLAGLEQAALDVAFTIAERKNVLTVPVAALLALSEGGYGVQLVEGSTTRIIAVEIGLFAGGRVEVSGAGLTEGATVGMPA